MTFIDFMAGLAIAVFWVHMLLMAADAVVQWRGVRRLAARWRGNVVAGEVVDGRGPAGALAEHRVDQRGRSKGDGRIHFHDRGFENEIFGGRVRLDDGSELELAPASGDAVQVWPSPEASAHAAAPVGGEALQAAYAQAQKAKGWTRVVRVPIRAGARVWVHEGADGRLVSLVDPRAWTRSRAMLVIGFVVLHLLLSAACTVLALWPPVYDTVSKIGAFVSFVYFMQVQDFTRIIRERVRPPSTAFVRGQWRA